MGKRSNRRPVRHEKDQLGCMWGLITMFDFRHGRTTQRLLSDRRRGNGDEVDIGSSGNKLDMSASLGEEKEILTITCKPSVKKLLEEEMSREQVANVEANNTDSGGGDSGRRNRKRRNKTRQKSSSNSLDVDAAKNLVLEVSCEHKSEQQTTSSLDVGNLVEEFCWEIDQKRIDCVSHDDQPAEGHTQPSLKGSNFEERLSEAIKFLVSQKLINRNQLMEGGELQASKEVMDALQVLSLDEELFLKLLRDPNSLLVKYVKDLPDAQDEESKPLVGSNFSEQEPVGLRQLNEPVNRKQRNFFRRRSKFQERDSSDGNKVSEASTRIVVLKPGPTCSQTPETGSSHGASLEPKHIIRHREPNDKFGSHFFLTEIKRKWKHAMGREQRRLPTNEITKRVSGERKNSSDAGGFKEYIAMNSPTKDHFFIERVAKPSIGVKKGERMSNLKGSETSTDCETNFSRHSNIYIEAKKHLSEMLTNGDDNVDLSSRQVPKTLARILSLPDYNSSPVGSPRRSSEHSSITTQTRFGSDKFIEVHENNELDIVSHLSQEAEELGGKLCISDDKDCDEIQGDNIVSDKLGTFVNDDKVDQNDCSTKDETSSGGAVSIVKETEILVQEETKLFDASSETRDTSLKRDDKIVASEVFDEKQHPQCSKQELSEEDQQSFSPLASPSNSPVTKTFEGIESVSDIQERPSPVSVLEPIFADDVISPASIRSISGETSIQPLRIRFEAHGSSANHSGHFKTCMDDKESILEHIKVVLQASSFDWDELYIRSLSSDQLLDPLLLDEVEYLPNQLCHDKKLLFDCINEVLVEVCGYYFGSPGVSFVKTNIRPLPNMENAIEEIWQRVYWHVLPMPLPRTLDQVVRKDLAKTGTWMDLRLDADFISVEIAEDILKDLVEDSITSYISVSPDCEYHAEGLEE